MISNQRSNQADGFAMPGWKDRDVRCAFVIVDAALLPGTPVGNSAWSPPI